MNWIKVLSILVFSALLSLHAKANTKKGSDINSPVKDSVKVEQKVTFDPLMFFSLPKAKSSIREEDLELEEKRFGAI